SNAFSNYRITGPTAAFSIGSISYSPDGKLLTLFNRTNQPMTLLHENAAAAASERIITGTGANLLIPANSCVNLQYEGGAQRWVVRSHSAPATGGGGNSFFAASGADIYNTNTANVGIGTNSPAYARLQIAGRVGAAVAIFGSDAQGVAISANNPEIGFNYFYNNTTKTIKPGYGANFGMDPGSGKVYLGNFSGNQSTTDFGDITGYQYVMTVTQSGNVGLGTTDPSYRLHVVGQGFVTGNELTSPGLFGNITSGGSFFIRTTSTGNTLAMDGSKLQSFKPNQMTSGSTAQPLYINPHGGDVGIGTTNTAGYKLAVNGSVRAKEIRVNTGWADYVFEKNYQLRTLDEVEAFIKANQHLPGIWPAAQIAEEGADIGATQTKLLEKIEELTLYLIEANKSIKQLQQQVKALQQQPK
ncbi:MAG TPA: hypothetical protein PKD90_18265, partial [Phnomibacter sp.]|nr:hypothetical protein [Phnomibacter sp.]